MTFQSAVGKLQSPIQELVLAVTKEGTRHVGNSDQDKTEVEQWIEKVAQGDAVKEGALKVRLCVYQDFGAQLNIYD